MPKIPQPQPQTDIFECLFKNNICFAVCVSFITSALPVLINGKSLEYHLLINIIDRPKMKKFFFKRSMQFYTLLEHELTADEILRFKELGGKFVKVVNNQDGRIYELKNRPFKPLFQKLYAEAKQKANEKLKAI